MERRWFVILMTDIWRVKRCIIIIVIIVQSYDDDKDDSKSWLKFFRAYCFFQQPSYIIQRNIIPKSKYLWLKYDLVLRSGNVVAHIDEVSLCLARLVGLLGWVTDRIRTGIPPRLSTGQSAMMLCGWGVGSNGRHVSFHLWMNVCVAGEAVWSAVITRAKLSALEMTIAVNVAVKILFIIQMSCLL